MMMNIGKLQMMYNWLGVPCVEIDDFLLLSFPFSSNQVAADDPEDQGTPAAGNAGIHLGDDFAV